ncbi:MAG TPA: alpha/beta fold hydrolase [Gemmatimonadales bacterium]|nr:alpha/beta fold hydrolase [Gemmatimonadales bacterium]
MAAPTAIRSLLAALLLLPAPLAAQLPATEGTFRIYQGKAEVGREWFHWSDTLFRQSVVIPVINLNIESANGRDASGRFARFGLTLHNAAGDTLLGSYRADGAGDSVHIESDLPKAPPPRNRAAGFDMVMPPQSVASLAYLIVRAGGRDTTWRLLMAGSDTVLAAPVRFSGDTARIRLGPIEIIGHDSAGRVQWLEIPAQRARAVYTRADENLPVLAGMSRPRPDYSAPPGAAYTAEEVRVPVTPAAGDTFSLGCTLTLPKAGKRPVPAAITITGSGLQGRDEDLWPTLANYRPFRQVAERLATIGVATLRCDDRGKDASGGDPKIATTVDLANDTRAQLAWLRARPEINPARVVLIGHSEGGIIAPMLAAEDRRIAGIVLLAGPGKPGAAILRDQARWPVLTDSTLSAADRATKLAAADSSVRADSGAAGAWFQWFYHYDPLPTARRVTQPTLILHGAVDRQVSAGQADTLARAIRAGGNRRVTVKVFPQLNHLFLVSMSDGSPAEYGDLKDPRVPATVLDTIADWLTRLLRP